MTRPDMIEDMCKGDNPRCKAARKQGMFVHIIPSWSRDTQSIILPTYHYSTREDAIAALERARTTAPVVTCDADLYEFRARAIAHKLPVGWIDPSRR